MSEFSISADQRRQLLEAGNNPDTPYEPLDFDTKPYVPSEDRGLERGDVYVLAWQRAFAIVCDDGHVIRVPRRRVWFLTVTAVQRHRKGFWRVRFDVTDLRDPTVWLRAGSGYTTSRRGAVDPLPVVVDESVREKAREEHWVLERLKRHDEQQRQVARAKRQRKAA